MLAEVLPLLFLGFGLGLIHAFDADHIMAVSVLSHEKPSFKRTLIQSAHWALGHGGTLIFCSVLLFGVGVALPDNVQKIAEMSVGLLLIVLGVLCFRQCRQDKLTLEFHHHGDIAHTHWHDGSQEHLAKNNHKPVFVGMLHGLAGSAPVLALIPAVSHGDFVHAVMYVLLFSCGVMLAMMCFGFGFAHLQRFLSQRYQSAFQLSRQVLAFSSMAFGGYWLLQAV